MSKDYETIKISKCCKVGVFDDYDEDKKESIFRCDKCGRKCETEEVCEHCYGDGFTDSEETVYQGEPYKANIGRTTCICSIDDGDPYGGDGQDD